MQIINEYCNQNNIVEIAMQSLQRDAKSEDIEDDWLGRFMDKAKFVSSLEFQCIWGKILARECNKPGSIPLALLYTLEKMDKEDAKAFIALCRTAIRIEEEYVPVIINSRFNEYQSLVGLNLHNLLNLL